MIRDTECGFGPVEYGGTRYCHTHHSFLEPWHENRSYCPRAIELATERRAQQAIENEEREC